MPLSHQPESVHSCCCFRDWEKREDLERKTKNLDCPQVNQCQLLMMLVMLGLWKPFMKHVKLTFKANKPHCHQFKFLPPPAQFFTDSSSLLPRITWGHPGCHQMRKPQGTQGQCSQRPTPQAGRGLPASEPQTWSSKLRQDHLRNKADAPATLGPLHSNHLV